jgi:ketosteroid isomerase-like protein
MTEATKDVVPAPALVNRPIAAILRDFVDGFNTNSLDQVMTFFADDAVYDPGDGHTHRGPAAIREAFLPQFSNAFGSMRFVVNDWIVDEGARKAVIRWVCQHDLSTMKPSLQRLVIKTLYGPHPGWHGTDTFHFDERGKIVGKFTYAHYGTPPSAARSRPLTASLVGLRRWISWKPPWRAGSPCGARNARSQRSSHRR